ncbi:MAG: PAS domain-containing sensor histidine kinase [Ignavibacteria bacterium]|nr:PAS domain-containing sensor histidine kinase [Ignavibacteria bacterium]
MKTKKKISKTGLLDFETIFNNVTDLIFLFRIESENKYIYEAVNKSYLKVSKIKENQVIGKTLKELLPASTYKNVNKIYKNIIRSKKPVKVEEVWSEFPKDTIVVETHYLPILNDDNIVTHILGSSRDITDRKNREKELFDVQTTYKDLFDTVTEAIYILDGNGNFIDVNDGALKMYGFTKKEFIGKTPEFLSAPDMNDLNETMSALKRAFDGKMQIFKWWGRRKNKEIFPKEVILNKAMYMGKEVVIATARDITDRVFKEDTLRKYALELQSLNTSKDKFFSIIAHDLRSPFNGLLGFSKVLFEEFDELTKDELKEYIGYVYSSSKNVYKLIENLLQWSRIQAGRLEFQPIKLDLYEEVYKVVNLFTSMAIEKKIVIENTVAPNTIIWADQNMTTSILQNLISNSLKFTNSGGTIVVQMQKTNTGYYEISVLDNGIGISPENIKKLCKIDEHFSTVGTANEEGSGLGLVLCKEMVDKNKGYFNIESKKGEGTKITFAIPIQK